jgi:hypothetical protein
LDIAWGGTVHVGDVLEITNGSILNLLGGTLRFNTSFGLHRLNFSAGTVQLAGDRNVGVDPAINTLFGAVPVIPTGKGLTIEEDATVSSVLYLDGGTLRTDNLIVNGSLHFSGGLLELTGGIITGQTDLTVPTSGEFRARGVQSLRVTGAAGSTITATGNLTLGNAAAVNGFGTQGTLRVGDNSVTLLDANDVVFDSLSLATLGDRDDPGTLSAANGLTLDFGGNITGFGTISTPNNIGKPLINNGHITGNSAAQMLTLPGYVKGVGTFDNVNFTGTFSPGLSTTMLSVGNVAFSPSSTLVMELGGYTPGTQYDQINAAGELTLAGTLEISLINGFSPAAGQTFDLLNWGSLSGAFSAINLPTMPGLAWDTSQLLTGMLRVVPAGLPGDYNRDGVVDAADYVVWRESDGSQGGYNTWRAHFGQTADSGADANSNAAVPEPATLVLLMVAEVGWCLRRRWAA